VAGIQEITCLRVVLFRNNEKQIKTSPDFFHNILWGDFYENTGELPTSSI
jgi:hypothetical protein